MTIYRKSWLLNGIRAIVSVGLIYYLFNIVDWPRLQKVVLKTNISFVIIAIPVALSAIFTMAFRWRLLLASLGESLSTLRLFGYYLIGNGFNILLPGVIGGDVARMTLCARHTGHSIGTISGIIILERLCGLIALFIMGGAISFTLARDYWIGLGVPLVRSFQVISLIILCSVGIYWFFNQRLKDLPTKNDRLIVTKLKQLVMALSTIQKQTLMAVLALSAVAQTLDLLVAYILAKALGIELYFGLFFIIIPMTYLVTLLPISLGGVGVREGILSYLLTRVGVLATDAVTLAFIIYLLRVFIGMLGGIWYLFVKN
jgi:uncharacterized protein (TIRG00374 family)